MICNRVLRMKIGMPEGEWKRKKYRMDFACLKSIEIR